MNESVIRLFQLTVDMGHVHCLDEGDIPALVRTWGPRIVNVHIEDMVRGVHEHLMFGEGTMSFPGICQALREIGYSGGLHVELSRHSHKGVEAVLGCCRLSRATDARTLVADSDRQRQPCAANSSRLAWSGMFKKGVKPSSATD